MTAERAIELLSGGTHMPAVPHTTDELDEACRIACDALRLYTQSFQKAYSLNAAIADHYQNIGLPMERLDELAAADKAGRLVILPDVSYTDADGEEALRRAMWDCNYRNNGVTRFAADAIAEKLCGEAQKKHMMVKTPLGDIVVEASADPDNPGVWVSLSRFIEDHVLRLALIDCTTDEADVDGPAIITRIWQNAKADEYTNRIIHEGFGERGAK